MSYNAVNWLSAAATMLRVLALGAEPSWMGAAKPGTHSRSQEGSLLLLRTANRLLRATNHVGLF